MVDKRRDDKSAGEDRERFKAQLAERVELHLAGQHDQETHGNWAGGSDLEAKAAIKVGDTVTFVPKGGSRKITIRVTGKDRGRGGGISGVRVVAGIEKTTVNHYETPGIGEIEVVSGSRTPEPAAPRELTPREPASELVPAQRPPKTNVHTLLRDPGYPDGLSRENDAGIIEGAKALGAAGLVGQWTPVVVQADVVGKTRNGSYSLGEGMVRLKGSLGEGDSGFTFIHEWGHHMDLTDPRRNLSEGRRFKSAMRKTRRYKEMQAELKSPYTERGRKRWLRYALSWKELWARSVSQWATTRSGSPTLARVLEARRSGHWDDDDFSDSGVMAEMNRLLAEGGSTE